MDAEYEQIGGLWVPKYIQRNGVWVKRDAIEEHSHNLRSLESSAVMFPAVIAWGYIGGRTIEDFAAWQQQQGEQYDKSMALAEAEAILGGS